MPEPEVPVVPPVTSITTTVTVTPTPKQWAEYVKDVIAIFAGALMVLGSQLDKVGFSGIAWASVASAAIGGMIAWSRTGAGGFRKD